MARSTSKSFVTWSRDRHLVLYPDEFDGPSTSYLPGVGNVGVELPAVSIRDFEWRCSIDVARNLELDFHTEFRVI